jgi:hypothetical protein
MKKYFIQINILALKIFLNPVFIIKIENGFAKLVSGKGTTNFLNDCEEICTRNNIKHAYLYSIKGPYEKPILIASSSVTKDTLQQLRNVWLI